MIDVKPGDFVVACSEFGRAAMMRADSVGAKQVREKWKNGVGFRPLKRESVIFAGSEDKAEAVRNAIDAASNRMIAAKRHARDKFNASIAKFVVIRDGSIEAAAEDFKSDVAMIVEAVGQ